MSRLDLRGAQLADARVLVRHWEHDDLAALVSALQDREISRWVYPIPWPYTDGDGVKFLELARSESRAETSAHLAIVDLDTHRILGSIALSKIDWANASADLGYWVVKAARNQGHARRAASLVIRWAFDELRLERIQLLCDPANIASQRVADALGFQLEGHLRGHLKLEQGRRTSLLYGLLATDIEGSGPR